jgi:hypothetical protein
MNVGYIVGLVSGLAVGCVLVELWHMRRALCRRAWQRLNERRIVR